jgi:cyclophilin family peptidyl-prolyl cis-trans isomerase
MILRKGYVPFEDCLHGSGKHTRKSLSRQVKKFLHLWFTIWAKSFKEKSEMSKKSKRPQPRKGMDPIQLVAIGAVLLVAAWFVWKYLPKSQPAETTIPIGGETACGLFESIPAAAQYDSAPPLLISETSSYFAAARMAKGGGFVIQLFPDKAPITVNSFIFLACKGYFNGVTFHRVLDGFMAQGGDPTGTGTGGPGYEFVNEDSDLTFDKAGVVAMANAGRDTNGSQFFITFGPAEQLNGDYTIFGQVVEGMDVVNGITRRDPRQNPTFAGDEIESVTITEE